MIKNILIVLMAGILLCGFTGCPDDASRNQQKPPDKEQPVATNVPVPEKTQSPTEQNIDSLKKKLDDAEKKAAEATAKNDIIARLSAEKEALMLRTQIAEQYAKQWEDNAKSYKAQSEELKNAKIEAWKEKLWWMAGICGILAIVAGGVAFGFPLLRPIATKAAAILGGISIIMLIVAQCLATVAWLLGLIPYLLVLSAIVAAIFGAVALRHWFKDHNGLQQVVTGIEPLKDQIDDFGKHMSQYVDTPMETHIKAMRTKLGLKKQKDPEKESLKLALKQALAAKESEELEEEETEKTV